MSSTVYKIILLYWAILMFTVYIILGKKYTKRKVSNILSVLYTSCEFSFIMGYPVIILSEPLHRNIQQLHSIINELEGAVFWIVGNVVCVCGKAYVCVCICTYCRYSCAYVHTAGTQRAYIWKRNADGSHNLLLVPIRMVCLELPDAVLQPPPVPDLLHTHHLFKDHHIYNILKSPWKH